MKNIEKISILCPTRNRVQTTNGNFIYDLIDSARSTADNPECVEFVFYVDDDDVSSQSYFDSFEDPNIKVVCGPRIVLSEMWNKCYDKSSGDIVQQCGDDVRFRTQSWDTIVRDKFSEIDDRIAFVFGRDGYVELDRPKDFFGTHGFVHKNWVEVVGYFLPPYFSSDCSDEWLNDVAKMIDRHFYVEIYTEHLHPVAGKYVWDDTHKERLERHNRDDVYALYKTLSSERDDDAKALLKFIESSAS
jgi:hypothetical protein